jgi:cysteine synthase
MDLGVNHQLARRSGSRNNRVTVNLEGAPIDDAEWIPDAEALEHIYDVLIHEGLSVGTSSGIDNRRRGPDREVSGPRTHGGDDFGG